jgi:mevalonate kinase
MGGIGRASAKLILFGEHAAVHGYMAVGVSLPEGTTVRLSGKAARAWTLLNVAAEDRNTILAVLARMEELLPALASQGRCRVQVESNVVRGAGFGSSAALCSALARAALAHGGRGGPPWDRDRQWGLAHDAERLFHGTPSGIDTGLSLMDGMFAFRPRPPQLPECEPLFGQALHLVVAAVPRDEACGVLVASLGERVRSGERVACESVRALGGLAAAARETVCSGASDGAARIAGLADAAMENLRRLSLSTPWLDRLLAAGRSEGALGGKLSGAGGGGAFFLVVRDPEIAGAVAARLMAEARQAGIPLVSDARILAAGGLKDRP